MSDMNCADFRSYLQEDTLIHDLRENPEITMHLSSCSECRVVFDMKKEIGARLRLLRESVPAIPGSLDTAVLANYRRQIGMGNPAEARGLWRISFAGWRWGIAAAVALLVLAAVFAVRKPSFTTKNQPPTIRKPEMARGPVARLAHPTPPVRKNASVMPRVKPSKSNDALTDPAMVEDSPNKLDARLPDDFRSLMYCDELSCGGGMDVVRMQLPYLPSGFVPASEARNRVVTADVLVGADGFARGIRIVH
jgi:hypothetical protein